MSPFLQSLETKPYYHLIQKKYQNKIARRSNLPYINHIREGAQILHLLHYDTPEILEAYCLHPLFQSDKLLTQLLHDTPDDLQLITPQALILTMEYRRIANAYTIKHKPRPPESIDLGPLPQVHQMLTADKIQNKKDFQKHIAPQTNPKVATRSLQYFDSWLTALQITPENYNQITERIEQG